MIRRATSEDAPQIQELHDKYTLDVTKVRDNEYAAKVQKEGFTVSTGLSDAAEGVRTSQLFLVATDGPEVLGYIEVNREIYFPEDADNIFWFSDDLKHTYYHQDNVTVLHHIAAKRKGLGIAKALFDEALKELRRDGYEHIFSIVTTSPLTNCASVIWHTRNGFERACTTSLPENLFGLPNYGSILFHRNIKVN